MKSTPKFVFVCLVSVALTHLAMAGEANNSDGCPVGQRQQIKTPCLVEEHTPNDPSCISCVAINSEPSDEAKTAYRKGRIMKFFAYNRCMNEPKHALEEGEEGPPVAEPDAKECRKKVNLAEGDFLAEEKFQKKRIGENDKFNEYYLCMENNFVYNGAQSKDFNHYFKECLNTTGVKEKYIVSDAFFKQSDAPKPMAVEEKPASKEEEPSSDSNEAH
jgi:hypothetical protein